MLPYGCHLQPHFQLFSLGRRGRRRSLLPRCPNRGESLPKEMKMRNAFAPRFAALLVVGSLIMMVITSSPVLGADPYFKDVCAAGCTYSSVQAAIDSITDSGSTKVYTVFLDSGVLTSDTSISTQGKSYINFVGRGMGLSVLRASALWFQNVGGGLTSSDFFDMSGSTNVSVSRLTVDARTADPGGYGPTTSYSAVKVDLAATGKI